MYLISVERNPSGFSIIFWRSFITLEFVPASRDGRVPTGWQARTVLGDCLSKIKMKIKNPKVVVTSPTVFLPKTPGKKEVLWQQYRLCLAVAEYQILGGKHFLFLGPESGKIWCLKKVQYFQ